METSELYGYMVVNEHTGERLCYTKTQSEAEAQAVEQAHRHGSQRISVWCRSGTLEAKRVWRY